MTNTHIVVCIRPDTLTNTHTAVVFMFGIPHSVFEDAWFAFLTTSDLVLCFLLQQSAAVHVAMDSAPDRTCAPVPTATSPRPVDPNPVRNMTL